MSWSGSSWTPRPADKRPQFRVTRRLAHGIQSGRQLARTLAAGTVNLRSWHWSFSDIITGEALVVTRVFTVEAMEYSPIIEEAWRSVPTSSPSPARPAVGIHAEPESFEPV